MVIKGEGAARHFVGRLVRDPEFSVFGQNSYPKARFGLAYKKGDGGIVNVDALFALADACKVLKKGDDVVIDGVLESYEGKDGTKRWTLNAESITLDIRTINRMQAAPIQAQSQPDFEQNTSSGTQTGFTEITDSDLPF